MADKNSKRKIFSPSNLLAGLSLAVGGALLSYLIIAPFSKPTHVEIFERESKPSLLLIRTPISDVNHIFVENPDVKNSYDPVENYLSQIKDSYKRTNEKLAIEELVGLPYDTNRISDYPYKSSF